QSRLPGQRRGPRDQVPEALLKEELPEDSREAHVDEMRRLLYVAMTRARRRLVLAWPERVGAGSGGETLQKPALFYDGARGSAGRARRSWRERSRRSTRCWSRC